MNTVKCLQNVRHLLKMRKPWCLSLKVLQSNMRRQFKKQGVEWRDYRHHDSSLCQNNRRTKARVDDCITVWVDKNEYRRWPLSSWKVACEEEGDKQDMPLLHWVNHKFISKIPRSQDVSPKVQTQISNWLDKSIKFNMFNTQLKIFPYKPGLLHYSYSNCFSS